MDRFWNLHQIDLTVTEVWGRMVSYVCRRILTGEMERPTRFACPTGFIVLGPVDAECLFHAYPRYCRSSV